MRALLFALVLLSGCSGPAKQIELVTTIATVQTIEEGVITFNAWAVKEEDAIADEAINKCASNKTRPAFFACVERVATPRRAPIDRVKSAIRFYRNVLKGGAAATSFDVQQAAQSLIDAFAGVGLKVKL